MADYRHEGNAIRYIPDTDVEAGDIVELGELVGVARDDIDSGDLGDLYLAGVYLLADSEISQTADDVEAGDEVTLDSSEHGLVDTDGLYFGVAVEDGENDEVLVRLQQRTPEATES